jgi:hypothetical protein
MTVCSCRVTIQDLNGLPHTVEVTASSLFEAVAVGLTALHDRRLVPDGFAPVRVRLADGSAEYQVTLRAFTRWLDRRGNSPMEVIDRKRIRRMLGLSGSAAI